MKLLLSVIILLAISTPVAFGHITAVPPDSVIQNGPYGIFENAEKLQIYSNILYNEESDMYLNRANPYVTNDEGVSIMSLKGNTEYYAINRADIHYHGIAKNGLGGTYFEPQILPPFKIIGLYGPDDRPVIIRPYTDPHDPAELPEDLDDATPSKPHHDENNPNPDKPADEKPNWKKWLDYLIGGSSKANLNGSLGKFLNTPTINILNAPGKDPIRTKIFMDFVKDWLENGQDAFPENPSGEALEKFVKEASENQRKAEQLLKLMDEMDKQLDKFQKLIDDANNDPNLLNSPRAGELLNNAGEVLGQNPFNGMPDNIPPPSIPPPTNQPPPPMPVPVPIPDVNVDYRLKPAPEREIPQCCDPVDPEPEVKFAPKDKPPQTGVKPSPLSWGQVTNVQVWPDQCLGALNGNQHWIDNTWWLHITVSEPYCMNIKKHGGYTLVIPYDEKADTCDEFLCNFYTNEYRSVYDILLKPDYDTNQNGWIDKGDFKWRQFAAYEHDTGDLISLEMMGIEAVNLDNAVYLDDDYTDYYSWKDPNSNGIGQYSDCVYEQDEAYWKAIEAGWKCIKVSDSHERIVEYNNHGILYEDGTYEQTRDYVVGYWTPEQVMEAVYD